ncbi:MAG: RusA family crossover junction endodeoxyribonuclease [Elusimicrobiota bacterium]|jgi:hypothetical protein|nr:RusA family crossover junction endodeoxyribonuclease [Elusimicrobiota bacterium]
MKRFCIIISFLLICAAAPAQTPEQAQAALRHDKDKIELARPFEVEVSLPAPAQWDKDKFEGGIFEVISARRDADNILKTVFTVLPLGLGEADFPAFAFTDENGREIKTEPFKLEIKPTKTKTKTKGLVDILPLYRPFDWLRAGGWGLLAVLAALPVYFIFRRRPAPAAARRAGAVYNDGRPYHIIALEQIDKLLAENIWEQGLYKIFYIRAVDILCDYFYARFKVNAHRYTSRDLVSRMRTVAAFKGNIYDLRKFLQSADLVKFANAAPTAAERDLDLSLLRTIIEKTKQPETAIPPSPPAGEGRGERKEGEKI